MSSDSQTDTAVETETEKTPLKMDIQVDSPHTCLRHVVVTIPKEEVERYTKDAFDELVPDAHIPGFRAGRAPRKLVEKQFREKVSERVKSSLLMDSLAQVTDEAEFSAISEPDFDFESIELPDNGDFKYEFTVEVRPEFETPNWKGLALERPTEEISDEDVQDAIKGLLGRSVVPEAVDEPAQKDDLLTITGTFSFNGKGLSEMEEERVRLSDRLTFSDGVCEDFGKQMLGVREGERRSIKIRISDAAPNEDLRGQEIDAEFSVIEVARRSLPELTSSYLRELGDFESREDFEQFVRSSLERQVVYRQEQDLRKQIVAALTETASWELPPDLVRRQTRREVERKVLEMRRSGFDDDGIRRLVNVMRQNLQAATESSLREHFILEQIAEDEKIEADPSDYDAEIDLIAEQSDMPARRVRARLEKSNQMDALRNQIVERKVIEKITAEANVKDVPLPVASKEESEFALYHNVLGTKETDSIPEAKYDDKGPANEDDKK